MRQFVADGHADVGYPQPRSPRSPFQTGGPCFRAFFNRRHIDGGFDAQGYSNLVFTISAGLWHSPRMLAGTAVAADMSPGASEAANSAPGARNAAQNRS